MYPTLFSIVLYLRGGRKERGRGSKFTGYTDDPHRFLPHPRSICILGREGLECLFPKLTITITLSLLAPLSRYSPSVCGGPGRQRWQVPHLHVLHDPHQPRRHQHGARRRRRRQGAPLLFFFRGGEGGGRGRRFLYTPSPVAHLFLFVFSTPLRSLALLLPYHASFVRITLHIHHVISFTRSRTWRSSSSRSRSRSAASLGATTSRPPTCRSTSPGWTPCPTSSTGACPPTHTSNT